MNNTEKEDEKEYLFDYRFDGKLWGGSIFAHSLEEAEMKFRALCTNGKIIGTLVERIKVPIKESWVKKFITVLKRKKGSNSQFVNNEVVRDFIIVFVIASICLIVIGLIYN